MSGRLDPCATARRHQCENEIVVAHRSVRISLIMEDPTWMSAYFDLNALGDFDEPIANFEDMTAVELEAVLRDAWPNDALPTRHSSGQPKSPSPSSLPQGSVSPEDGNPEYTPTSSNVPDWSNDVNWNLQYDGLEISPMFATSTTDESDGISPIDSRCSVYSSMSRPPHSSQGISSVRRSRDSSPALPNTNTNGQWTSIAATMNMTGHQTGTAQAPSNTAFDDTAINTTEAFNQSLLSDMTLSYNTMPFRPAYTQSWGDLDMGQVSRHTMSDPPFAHPWSSFPLTTHDAHYLPTLPTTQHYAVQPDGPNQLQQINHTIDPVQHQRIPHYPSQLPSSGTIPQPSGNLSQQMPPTATVVPSTSPRPTQGPPPQSAYSRATQLRYRQPPSISIDTSACAPRSAQDLIAVVPARNVRSTTQPQSPEGKRPKGGRAKGGHLNPANKQRVARMRKTGACWRCAMQRDSVCVTPPQTHSAPLTCISVMVMSRANDASKPPASPGITSSLVIGLKYRISFSTFCPVSRSRTVHVTRTVLTMQLKHQ